MPKGVAGVAIPAQIAAAVAEYRGRCAELARQGISRDRADRLILYAARERGGKVSQTDDIDLSFWSEQLGIQRDVLEALVASRRNAPDSPSADPDPFLLPDTAYAVRMTPAPVATRRPRLDQNYFEFVPATEQGATTNNAYFCARFCFPDEATMDRCLAELSIGRGVFGQAAIGGVTVKTSTEHLELVLWMDSTEVDPSDVLKASQAIGGSALSGFYVA